MKRFSKILIMLICLMMFVSGCDQLLVGLGVGVAGSETLQMWEENLETKRIELDRLYDETIAEMKATDDPDELIILTEKADEIQLAKLANLGAITFLGELKKQAGQVQPGQGGGYLNLLHALIPIAVAWGGNELRKRLTSERKRQADKQGRELSLRQLAAMDEKNITAPVVKELIYKNIGDARKG